MRHGSRKVKVQLGVDANQMLMRKLAVNFFAHGVLTTTQKKAKLLKSHIERLVEKSKKKNEANKNFLLRKLANPKLVQSLFTSVGPVMADRIGGYVTLQKLYDRESDNALMVKVAWVTPVVMEVKPEVAHEEVAVKKEAKEAKKKVTKEKVK
jgi:large subunit ribosomal protein L17